jgi:hypothetical protein
LANRQSAQRSRMKRLQYINELEARKDKAESALRELRTKVDKTQRGQAGLAREVEQQHTKVREGTDGGQSLCCWLQNIAACGAVTPVWLVTAPLWSHHTAVAVAWCWVTVCACAGTCVN